MSPKCLSTSCLTFGDNSYHFNLFFPSSCPRIPNISIVFLQLCCASETLEITELEMLLHWSLRLYCYTALQYALIRSYLYSTYGLCRVAADLLHVASSLGSNMLFCLKELIWPSNILKLNQPINSKLITDSSVSAMSAGKDFSRNQSLYVHL